MKYLLIFAVLSCAQIDRSDQKTITVLPNSDKIYIINDDLGFEHINIAFQINTNSSEIQSLQITLYHDDELRQSISLSKIDLAHHLKTKAENSTVFQNYQMRFPRSSQINNLKITLRDSIEKHISKSFPLIRFEQKHSFYLPFNDTWFVTSGHDFGVEHRRHLSRGHFSWDFQKIDDEGKSSKGKELRDFYSYGQNVLAVEDGIVIGLKIDAPDNIPGKIESKTANYIEILHSDDIVSRYVHLKENSSSIKLGDSVKRGQLIAAVGNSGFSETPHLHIGFQYNIKTEDGKTRYEPLPIQFNDYLVTWNRGVEKLMEIGRPRRGQFIKRKNGHN